MAHYEEPLDETKEIFETVISNAELNRFIDFKLLVNNKQKTVYVPPIKASDLLRHMTNYDVIIVINEAIFDQLDEEQKTMVAEECIAGVHFDTEKDKIVISKCDVQTYSGFLRKYGYEKYEVLHESIKTLYNVQNEEEAEA